MELDWNSPLIEKEVSEYSQRLYNDYKWREVSQWVKDRDGCCQMCHSTKNLRAHHTKYVDFYNPAYLITLCDRCHEQVHDITHKFKELNLRSILRGVIQDKVSEIIDPYVIDRCAEINPSTGDLFFFRGPLKYRVNLNEFIQNLVELDPYGTEFQKTGRLSIFAKSVGNSTFTRYQKMRLEKERGNDQIGG